MCSSCGESGHFLPGHTQVGAGGGSLPRGSPSPPVREMGQKAGLLAGALEAGTERMQLQPQAPGWAGRPLQDPRTCGACGRRGTQAREPPGPDLLPGSGARTQTDLIQVLWRVPPWVDRGTLTRLACLGSTILRQKREGRGAELGQEEMPSAEQTGPRTTGLGVEGGPEPIPAPPGRAGQKSKLPGQRGPRSVPTCPSEVSPPGR